MGMLVMLVVHMGMGVGQGFVNMFVFVAFGQVQPNACRNETSGDHKLRCHRFAQHNQRGRGAQERRSRKVRACASGPEIAQGKDKESQA
jgi:hypothetical protein